MNPYNIHYERTALTIMLKSFLSYYKLKIKKQNNKTTKQKKKTKTKTKNQKTKQTKTEKKDILMFIDFKFYYGIYFLVFFNLSF